MRKQQISKGQELLTTLCGYCRPRVRKNFRGALYLGTKESPHVNYGKIMEMRKKGFSILMIAKSFGICERRVYQILSLGQ